MTICHISISSQFDLMILNILPHTVLHQVWTQSTYQFWSYTFYCQYYVMLWLDLRLRTFSVYRLSHGQAIYQILV